MKYKNGFYKLEKRERFYGHFVYLEFFPNDLHEKDTFGYKTYLDEDGNNVRIYDRHGWASDMAITHLMETYKPEFKNIKDMNNDILNTFFRDETMKNILFREKLKLL